ncbi:hypothetical protein Pla22_16970 [Rubripirellula amarantea]|uniref:DUF4832 domain-containing protein n=1 Tax=Rubripirellula amarantea TaxID=2527999 RepID=A0A5C5WW40_9BACT|nr:DUF4832 domain-containing protein [Rubripirellula amarantea]TWT54062.1 hypothetical protein Pla22_16970 [Rubripirellula amarantea]
MVQFTTSSTRNRVVARGVMAFFAGMCCFGGELLAQTQWKDVPLVRTIDTVSPWTGMVLWSESDHAQSDSIALEFSYIRYDSIVKASGQYDWSSIDQLLDEVASRKHQAVLRFHYVYPGKDSSVPPHVKASSGYKKIVAKSEGKKTEFVDWSHPSIEAFTLDFYTKFAARYDTDPRIAYLQTGFGLWAEYHIYSGPRKVGETFPSLAFQRTFVKHLDEQFDQLRWMISVDAADGDYSPFESEPNLKNLAFGVFDDSFLWKQHAKQNGVNWQFFGSERWKQNPAGGELSYYTGRDQKQALAETGPHGIPFEKMAADYHISFMIGNDQPNYQSMDRIRKASQAIGYRFRITEYQTNDASVRVVVKNEGVAPAYYDAFVAIDSHRSETSLRGLLPGETRECLIANVSPGEVTIESDRLVSGEIIPFIAELP